MAKIVITGICGFIGHHLARVLLEAGNEVAGIDDLSSGCRERIPSEVKVRELDISAPFAFRGLECDEIYHLACPASPPKYQADPRRTLQTCYLGTVSVLEHAKKTGARVLFTSTSEVYGDPEVHPQPESYCGNVHTMGPRAMYDEGKRVAETLCWVYHQQFGVESRIARIFNTYGPGMSPDDGRVITNFIEQGRARTPLTIYGDGTQTRSFCHADDTVRGLIMLMASEYRSPVNIGNPEEFTISELADTVYSALGVGGLDRAIRHHPLPEHDPKRRRPDIRTALQVLGWQPRIPLSAGILSMIQPE